ncbi:unnamed protein product [Notodromas monacha]|uniref:Uncharacterized protein n=1 Tax=Notodromas monacha TaxID=399045 RepID=A0A7R9G9R6_9CRUS|nr:unnamed protein product [Notodromas monacha]CAG0912894.1 unnamed protein product [Notodromas monacha]
MCSITFGALGFLGAVLLAAGITLSITVPESFALALAFGLMGGVMFCVATKFCFDQDTLRMCCRTTEDPRYMTA